MQMRSGFRAVLATSMLTLATRGAPPLVAQGTSSPLLGWSGWAQCDVTVRGPGGYSDQQTHTWIMSGGAPAVQGAFRIYPATWSAAGGGGFSRAQGTQTLDAQWATTVQSMSGPIAVYVRASDGRMLIESRHTQLRAPRAIQGYQQLTVDGKAKPPATIASEAFEWAFPPIQISRTSGPTPGTTILTANGSSTRATTGSVGFMQPAGSQGTAACTWQFGQGANAPAPPPAVAARAVPMPP